MSYMTGIGIEREAKAVICEEKRGIRNCFTMGIAETREKKPKAKRAKVKRESLRANREVDIY